MFHITEESSLGELYKVIGSKQTLFGFHLKRADALATRIGNRINRVYKIARYDLLFNLGSKLSE